MKSKKKAETPQPKDDLAVFGKMLVERAGDPYPCSDKAVDALRETVRKQIRETFGAAFALGWQEGRRGRRKETQP